MKMNGDANQIDTEAHNRQKASVNRCSGKQILVDLPISCSIHNVSKCWLKENVHFIFILKYFSMQDGINLKYKKKITTTLSKIHDKLTLSQRPKVWCLHSTYTTHLV